ncbi:Duplicated homeodomain superfamily protein [Trifolium repens]|nr:Duplicated homeodomain superfamily protein [Trifolium repens]
MATAAATMQWPTQSTREDVKIFKRALVMVPEDLPNRWEKIAEQGPGSKLYPDEVVMSGGRGSSDSDSSKKTRHADKEKRKKKKGRSWTEDEHKLFLAGLEK